MRIAPAKTKSDAVARAEGTYVSRAPQAEAHRAAAAVAGPTAEKQAAVAAAHAAAAAKAEAAAAAAGRQAPQRPPNKVLLAEGLPQTTTVQQLTDLFRSFGGFVQVRAVPNRPDIAFIEFSDVIASGTALAGLQSFKLGGAAMMLSFAKQ